MSVSLSFNCCLFGGDKADGILIAGSQLPLFFVGGTLAFIPADIGEATVEAWMPIVYSLVLALVAPFCGYLQDLFGRRNITLAGGVVLSVGIIVVATAQSVRAVLSPTPLNASASFMRGKDAEKCGRSEALYSPRGSEVYLLTFPACYVVRGKGACGYMWVSQLRWNCFLWPTGKIR